MPAGDFQHVVITEPLISLEHAKDQLRIPQSDTTWDDEIGRTVLEAQNAILDYLKKGADPTWTAETLPLPVLAAVKKMLTHLFEDRGDDPKKAQSTTGDSGEAVWNEIGRLLERFRDPACA